MKPAIAVTSPSLPLSFGSAKRLETDLRDNVYHFIASLSVLNSGFGKPGIILRYITALANVMYQAAASAWPMDSQRAPKARFELRATANTDPALDFIGSTLFRVAKLLNCDEMSYRTALNFSAPRPSQSGIYCRSTCTLPADSASEPAQVGLVSRW